jgi:hypothetical protein
MSINSGERMLRTALKTFSASSVAWAKTRMSMYPIGILEDKQHHYFLLNHFNF